MAKYIKLEDLMKFPIRLDHYDKEHGSKDFVYGIETVLEYAENLQTEVSNPVKTNADRIRSMSDEELAEFLTDINPTNCQDCGFSHGWRCQPDRDDYSDFEKCKEGRKRWLKQPAEEADNETD